MDEIDQQARGIACVRDERLKRLKDYARVVQALAAGPVYPASIALSDRYGFIAVTADTEVLHLADDWIRSVARLTEEDPFNSELIAEAVIASHLVVLQKFIASVEPAALETMSKVRGVFEMVWRRNWDGHRLTVEFPVRHLRNILREVAAGESRR
jgi:hypothetical protein